jgi:hypothetical protein
MIDSAGRSHNLATLEPIVPESGRPQAPRSQSLATGFSDELANRMAAARANIELPGSPPTSQPSGMGQDSATGRASPALLSDLLSAAPTTTAPATTVSTSNTTSTTTSGTTSGTVSGTSTGTSGSQTESFDDAYWASQPPAVQQLRNIQSPEERQSVATQLANEGYTIDVPIMVWGWDPQTTMEARAAAGYTWVPSALQQPVSVAPGVTYNQQTYNPANPPQGSITVQT